MTYQEAVMCCKDGVMVTDGDYVGKAEKIIVLFGTDYIETSGVKRPKCISVKYAKSM